jgi:hypothetical protein
MLNLVFMSNNGFYLEAHDVTASVDPSVNREFTVVNDGAVTNLRAHECSLMKYYSGKKWAIAYLPLIGHLFLPSGAGGCAIFRDAVHFRAHIYQRKGLSRNSSLFVQGHEEGHILDAIMDIENMARVTTKIAAYYQLSLDQWSWDDKESRANAGGLIALKRLLDAEDEPAQRKIQEFKTSIANWIRNFDCSFRYWFSDGSRTKQPFRLTLE